MSTISEKLVIIAENEQRVYDAGKAASDDYQVAYSDGYEGGKVAERETFWNAFTQNQTRTDYSYAFNNWSKDNFYPTCDIKGTNMSNAFRNFQGSIDLITRCAECNIYLDFSECTKAF